MVENQFTSEEIAKIVEQKRALAMEDIAFLAPEAWARDSRGLSAKEFGEEFAQAYLSARATLEKKADE